MLIRLWHEMLIDFDAQRCPRAVVVGVSHRDDATPDVRRYLNWRAYEDSLTSECGEALAPEAHDEFSGDDTVGAKSLSYYRLTGGLWKIWRPGADGFLVTTEMSQRENGDWGILLQCRIMLIQQWLPPGDYGDPMPMDPTLWDRLSRGGLEG